MGKQGVKLSKLGYTAIPVTCLVIFAYIAANPTTVGMTAGDGNLLVELFPSLFLILVSVYLLAKSRGTGKFGGVVGFGLGLVFFLGNANDQGLVTAELLQGLTINQLQIWVMCLSVIIGGIVYSYSK